MKRILINATHAEEIRVALCNGNHLYDFDLENRTREQKKANIYKGHVTRVEPSLEAVFVEYGAERQGFLPIREIAGEYLSGDPRGAQNIKQLIKEGDELIVQVEKEERGNKGAALSTFISLAGRYLVLMPNNTRGGGISRQISGKYREELKQILNELKMPKGMSVIIRTAGVGRSVEELQHDLDHLLTIWQSIQQQYQNYPSPRLLHQEAGVVTRAVRDYLRDDISEIWIDNEYAYNEAANFIEAVMPQQLSKLRKYTDYEPMFARFGIEKQIETAYQREVRLPSGGSIVIDQTEALVSIDINSSKATKGADVSETAFNTNLEAADEIARQLRLRDMGGLIVIDFIDMSSDEHQKQVENRLKDATKNDRARLQFAEISRFGLLEMSRQRLRPSLEEATGYRCPRCHGTGMIRDLRSLALSIMRQVEQKALQERQGEIQVDVPTEIAAFLLNEKRESLVYLEQESGTRITILPHAHMDSPEFRLSYNRDGLAPSSYERVNETEQQAYQSRGYDTSDWHTEEQDTPRRHPAGSQTTTDDSDTPAKPAPETHKDEAAKQKPEHKADKTDSKKAKPQAAQQSTGKTAAPASQPVAAQPAANQAVAWLSNLFAPPVQASLTPSITSQDAAAAIESIINSGARSLGVQGQLNPVAMPTAEPISTQASEPTQTDDDTSHTDKNQDDKPERGRNRKHRNRKNKRSDQSNDNDSQSSVDKTNDLQTNAKTDKADKADKGKDNKEKDKSAKAADLPKREPNSHREPRGEKQRGEPLTPPAANADSQATASVATTEADKQPVSKAATHERSNNKAHTPDDVTLHVYHKERERNSTDHTVHLQLDDLKHQQQASDHSAQPTATPAAKPSDATTSDAPTATAKPANTNAQTTSATTAVTPTSTEADAKPTADTNISLAPNARAKNDPREAYRAYQAQLAIAAPTAQPPATQPSRARQPISGTVGQFIAAQLANAEQVIAQVGIVGGFIQAMNAYHAAATDASEPQTADTPRATEDAAFGTFFSQHYGYSELSDESLAQYHAMIAPEGQYQTDAGKTHAAPAPVTQRASNDPRGAIIEERAAAQITEPAASQSIQADNTKPTENVEHTEHTETQNELAQKTEDTAEMVQAAQPAQAEPSDPANEANRAAENDEDADRPKTTVASYKNMIESVAEQMKPQTVGILTLATPKAPKVRTRKAKASDKAPAKTKTRTSKKAENAVVVTRKPTVAHDDHDSTDNKTADLPSPASTSADQGTDQQNDTQ